VPGDRSATLRLDANRSRVAAIDAAIASVAGQSAMSAGEVIDLLLDMRTRIVFSEILAYA